MSVKVYSHFPFILNSIMYHIKKWPRFSFSNIYVITIVKINYRPNQNLFKFHQQTSMDSCKIGIYIYGKCLEN